MRLNQTFTDETVRTFIEQTRGDYGGDIIRQLAERYKLKSEVR